jgi:hypothetical protein
MISELVPHDELNLLVHITNCQLNVNAREFQSGSDKITIPPAYETRKLS